MEYSFSVEFATKYGVNEAIMIKNFQFWISKNIANGVNLHDDRTWTFNSVRAFADLFPFWTSSQISRVLNSLVKQEVLMVGNYNKAKYDRTKWFAFVDQSSFVENDKCILPKRQMHLTKTKNAIVENDKPIPYSKTKNSKTKDTIYIDIIAAYDSFCQNRFDAPAKINGIEGKAAKRIIAYLKKVAQKKGYEDKACVDSFKYILNNWHKLDAFTQKQVKLSQIDSNLTNIINQIKNGQGTTQQSGQSFADEIRNKYAS